MRSFNLKLKLAHKQKSYIKARLKYVDLFWILCHFDIISSSHPDNIVTDMIDTWTNPARLSNDSRAFIETSSIAWKLQLWCV